MTPVLITLIAVVAVGLTIASARRALAERDAVERHHRTLDVLGTLSDRAEAAASASAAPSGREYRPRHRRPRPHRRGSRPAVVAGIAGALALAVALGAVWLMARRGGGTAAVQGHPDATPTTTTAVASSNVTTVPAGPAVVLVSSDSQQASFRVARTTVDVELVPTAPCWVEIKSPLGHGPVVFSGTLRPGARRNIPIGGGGGASVRLGNPTGMTVSVDGDALAFPAPTGTKPFTLLFQSPGA